MIQICLRTQIRRQRWGWDIFFGSQLFVLDFNIHVNFKAYCLFNWFISRQSIRDVWRHVSWICRWESGVAPQASVPPTDQSTQGVGAWRNVANISRCPLPNMAVLHIESLMTDREKMSQTRLEPTSNVDWHWTLQCGLTWLERCSWGKDFLLDICIDEKQCWLKTAKAKNDQSVWHLPAFAMDHWRLLCHRLCGSSLGNLQRSRHPTPRVRLSR